LFLLLIVQLSIQEAAVVPVFTLGTAAFSLPAFSLLTAVAAFSLPSRQPHPGPFYSWTERKAEEQTQIPTLFHWDFDLLSFNFR
jgi:hypothetical protein